MENQFKFCMDDFMNQTLEIRPGRLINVAIYDNPTSTATIFLIHGMGGRSAQWRNQIAALQGKYTLIVPDLLGHGASTKPTPNRNNPYNFLDFYQDLKILFDKYAGKQNIVIGHSYGGALAAYLTALNFAKVTKLILISPIPCQAVQRIKFVYKLPIFIIKLLLASLQKKFQAAAFAPMTSSELIAQEGLGSKCNQLYVIKAMGNALTSIPFVDLKPVTTPTLIILGKFDKIISNVQSVAFYEALPNHTFYVVENAAHMAMLEQSAEVNQKIEQFISE
jgi:pimeloyl-ACP methyl ester carboxylesterase